MDSIDLTSNYYEEDSACSYAIGYEKPNIMDWLLIFYLFVTAATSTTSIYRVASYVGIFVAFIFIISWQFNRVFSIFGFWLMIATIAWFWFVSQFSVNIGAASETSWFVSKIVIGSLMLMARSMSLPKLSAFLKSMVIGCAVLAVSGAVLGYSAASTGFGDIETGLAGQRNAYGGLLLSGVLAALILYPISNKKWRVIIWIYYVAVIISLLASGSRGATVSCALVFGVYFFLEYLRHMKQNLKMIIPITLLAIIVPFLVIKFFPNALLVQRLTSISYEGTEGASSGRVDLYREAWGIFLDHKGVGIGPGMYAGYGSTVYTHTTFLEILTTAGIGGFIIFYSVYLYAWVQLTRLVKIFRYDHVNRKLFNACRASLIAITFYGAFQLTHYNKLITFLLGIIIGFSANSLHRYKTNAPLIDEQDGQYDQEL